MADSGGEDAAADDSFWCRRFCFGGLRVAVEEEFGAGLGGTVWSGAVALARHLSEAGGADAAADELLDAAPLTALELGAGCCGLPSLAAAHCGRFARVVVTDCGEVLPRLRDNIAANASAAGSGCTLEVIELDWSHAATLAATTRAHLLLAADCAYGMDEAAGERGAAAAEVLANALAVLAMPGAVVLLAQLLRPLHEETALHAALCRRFRLEQLPPSDGTRAVPGLGIFRLHPLP